MEIQRQLPPPENEIQIAPALATKLLNYILDNWCDPLYRYNGKVVDDKMRHDLTGVDFGADSVGTRFFMSDRLEMIGAKIGDEICYRWYSLMGSVMSTITLGHDPVLHILTSNQLCLSGSEIAELDHQLQRQPDKGSQTTENFFVFAHLIQKFGTEKFLYNGLCDSDGIATLDLPGYGNLTRSFHPALLWDGYGKGDPVTYLGHQMGPVNIRRLQHNLHDPRSIFFSGKPALESFTSLKDPELAILEVSELPEIPTNGPRQLVIPTRKVEGAPIPQPPM